MLVSRQLEFATYSLLKPGHYIAAISGGLDSMALFYLLCHLKKKKEFSFEVVTIDHRIREGSARDAAFVQKKCEINAIPCRVETLDTKKVTKNIEEQLRQMRYEKLLEHAKQVQASGILLAHHRDDQIEGVFKRLLEGGKPIGMQRKYARDGIELLRPFLEISKEQLRLFINENQLDWVEDPSNTSKKFTRNRMRHQILPLLEEKFGKSIGNNLLHLSKKMRGVDQYLHEKLAGSLKVQPIREGHFIDWSEQSLHNVELEYLLELAFKQVGLLQNRFLIADLAKHIQANEISGPYQIDHMAIYCDRKRLFFLEKMPSWDWLKGEGVKEKGWQACLQGVGLFFAPENAKMIEKENLPAKVQRSLQRLYIKYKVPVFLQKSVPVLFDGNLAYECLTPVHSSSASKRWICHNEVSKKPKFATLVK